MIIKKPSPSLWMLALLLFGPHLGAQDAAIVYPQLAVGGGFEVILTVTNSGAEPWQGEAVAPQFGAGSGVEWRVNGDSMAGADRFPISMAPRATQRFVLSAPDGAAAVAGSLEIRALEGSSAATLATSFFYDFSSDGALVDSVGAPPARAAFHAVIPVELDPASGANTGIAIRRLSTGAATAGGNASETVFKASLYDQNGGLVSEIFEDQPGARFFDQMFAASLPLDQPFLGSMTVESEEAFHLTALRQRLLEAGRFQLTGVPALIPEDDAPAPSFTARYRVTFEAKWSAATHPEQFPVGAAHFSPLVGGVHDARASFWAPGRTATVGIEQMAELGSTGPLSNEVREAINAATAGAVLLGSGIGQSPGMAVLEFQIDQRYPLVTLVSMVAPSPDWFVGVGGLALFRDGRWVDDLTISLYPFDAGTDSGTTYLSPNADTQPRGVVREITGSPFLDSQGIVQPLGTYRFERIG